MLFIAQGYTGVVSGCCSFDDICKPRSCFEGFSGLMELRFRVSGSGFKGLMELRFQGDENRKQLCGWGSRLDEFRT